MELKQIPFVEMERGRVLGRTLANGNYAQINYSARPVGLYKLPNPFPWSTTAFAFKDGDVETLGSGSSPGDVLTKHEVTQVFLIGIKPKERAELDEKLRVSGYVLVPA